MRWFLAAGLAVLAFPAGAVRIPLLSGKLQTDKSVYRQGQWRLTIRRSEFSGDVRCRLTSRNHKIVYQANALGFGFDEDRNTLDAWVRIDGDPPYRWRDDLPELARLGVAIDGRNLAAPTGGIVWIPAADLIDANRVTIQWGPGRKPKLFRLHGFAGLREVAHGLGCLPETRFVP